jgi:hypothetical protein
MMKRVGWAILLNPECEFPTHTTIKIAILFPPYYLVFA